MKAWLRRCCCAYVKLAILIFWECRGQSSDNAANLSGYYKGMQQKTIEANKLAIYVPCGARKIGLLCMCPVVPVKIGLLYVLRGSH